jgi:protein tyrosine/serine phosphatase
LKKHRFRNRVCVAVVAIIFILGALSYVGVFNGNVRVVEPNQVYRSAQLRGTKLVEVLKSDHIKSVVNLRGYLPNDPRLRNEMAVCKRMGIKHVDVKMSAIHLPQPIEVKKLLNDFDTLPRPMLIHCAGGADRSGLACTLYLNVCKGFPLDQAESSQLTWRYGHISFLKARAMDEFFNLYRRTNSGLTMRKWVTDRYPQVYSAVAK